MKLTIWDILSVLMILSTLCLCGLLGYMILDENNTINPFPPPTARPTVFIIIPTSTPSPRSLPPTWTQLPEETQGSQQATLRPSSTPMPTFTSFVIPSFTASITITFTPTATLIPTNTMTVTRTPVPTFTQVPATLTPTP